MTSLIKAIRARYVLPIILGMTATARMHAQVFNGTFEDGVERAGEIKGPFQGTIREVALNILLTVLNFLALAAVIAIIVAGIFLIVSGGSEESKDRAKRIILYVIIGLVVIFLSRVIVGLFLGLPTF